MPTTPNITLTATLDDLSGNAAGSLANPAKLRICLCGYGQTLPLITGTTMLARVGPFSFFSTGAALSIPLWGNDQITPAGTYYSIEILDGQDNVVQCGAYLFTGSGTVDLSNTQQIVPPYGFPLGNLAYQPCAGSGSTYVSPGAVIAATYNGIAMPLGPTLPATLSYTLSIDRLTITLNFSTDPLDRIDAFCIL